jgi:hypothetical protein
MLTLLWKIDSLLTHLVDYGIYLYLLFSSYFEFLVFLSLLVMFLWLELRLPILGNIEL